MPKDEVRGIRRARARVAALDARDGLDAAPTLRGQVVMRYGAKDVSATLIGIEPERERRVSQIEGDLTAGDLESLHTAANGVILGSGLVRKLGVRMGETLTATAPTGVRLLMKVVGTFHTGAVAVDSFPGLRAAEEGPGTAGPPQRHQRDPREGRRHLCRTRHRALDRGALRLQDRVLGGGQ